MRRPDGCEQDESEHHPPADAYSPLFHHRSELLFYPPIFNYNVAVSQRTFTNFKLRISEKDLRDMEEALARNPGNKELLDWLAFAYYCNKMEDKAIECYRRLLTMEPDNASYHYYLGNAYFSKKLYSEAEKEWQKVLLLDKTGKFTSRTRRKLEQISTASD